MKAFIVTIFSLIPALLFAQAETGSSEQIEELATVAIANYFNKTGSEDYKFLSTSIARTVAGRMQEKFSFIRAPEEKVKTDVDAAYTLNPLFDQLTVKTLVQTIPADVIVYGEFNFNRETNEITMVTSIYVLQADALLTLPPVVNPGDSTIFTAIEKTADQLVDEIARLAAPQEDEPQASAENGEEGGEKQEEKIVLTKTNVAGQAAKEKRDYYRWFVGAEAFGPAWYGGLDGGVFFTKNIYFEAGGSYFPRSSFDFFSIYGGAGYKYGYLDVQIGPAWYYFVPGAESTLENSANYFAAYTSVGVWLSWKRFFVKPSLVYIKDFDDFSAWEFNGNKSFLTFGVQAGVRF